MSMNKSGLSRSGRTSFTPDTRNDKVKEDTNNRQTDCCYEMSKDCLDDIVLEQG